MERAVTQEYNKHKVAEDYSGPHMSNIVINGRAKVVHVVNKYRCYYDTIDANEFDVNKDVWKEGNYYQCLSISGNKSRFHQSEMGGNQVKLEFYIGEVKYYLILKHLAEVFVKEGDIINDKVIVGTQGNTGLVRSGKSKNDITYGTHVHVEIWDHNFNKIDPRAFVDYSKRLEYKEQSNVVDSTKYQIKIIADKINIRETNNVYSTDLGDVCALEVYDVLEEVLDKKHKWYKIKTNLGVSGYVGNEIGKNWIEEYPVDSKMEGEHFVVDEMKNKVVIFECSKEGIYAIQLKQGEKLYVED